MADSELSAAPSEASPDFSHPTRGTETAYARYLSSMDASMRQKVALTAAHLLSQGKVADMGMGSGTGSHALAALYPGLQVVGVDIDPHTVELARERYRLPNLGFAVGDIAERVFAPESLDGILDSSVLHHVTSFGGYRHENAARALERQVEQLRPGGVLVVRDFVAPDDAEVWLELPADDGDDSDLPERCSTAQLFERFAREFRSLSSRPGFSFRRVEAPGLEPARRRYAVSQRHAAEFILRKDYRADWVAEVKEEYTYFTQRRFEALFAALGLRLLASTPLWNPWIVRTRWAGKVALRKPGGEELELPPTNYVVVGEKVPAGEGVRFVEGPSQAPLGFLVLEYHRHRRSGEVRELVRRPNLTLDLLPWFQQGTEAFVLARMSYPRPILRSPSRAAAALDGATPADYVTEPLTVMQTDKPLGQTVEEALQAWASLAPEKVLSLAPGTSYYPSPGGLQEEVRSVLVEVEPTFVSAPIPGRSGFSTAGRVRAIEAQQLLRAAQVGGLPDARLELNVYELLLRQGLPVGPWIGESLAPRLSKGPFSPASSAPRPPRRSFVRVAASEGSGFLSLRCQRFDELDAGGRTVASKALEYVVPTRRSAATVSTALVRRVGEALWLGLDDDDLPAAQAFTGHSQLWVTPAWRLPPEVSSMPGARSWIRARLGAEYGVECGELWTLGGSYHPSPGSTPEVVFPWAVEVLGVSSGERPLHWFPLDALVARRAELADGHLRIALLRAAHALGRLG